MAAGLTAHVGTLQEVLRFRVPPWPQPQVVSERGQAEDREVRQDRWAGDPVTRVDRGLENPFRRLLTG
jgi:hypothetical protein